MSLIDIQKLNAELDKMITAQETEIKRINEEIEAGFVLRWEKMILDLRALDDCARELDMKIRDIYAGTMPPESSGRCWWDTLYYTFGDKFYNRPLVYGKNCTGDTGTIYLVCSDDERNRRTTTILKYWEKYKDKIHADFEAACIKALKQKAENANARYLAALKEKEKSK